jgi:hypothetical protein
VKREREKGEKIFSFRREERGGGKNEGERRKKAPKTDQESIHLMDIK